MTATTRRIVTSRDRLLRGRLFSTPLIDGRVRVPRSKRCCSGVLIGLLCALVVGCAESAESPEVLVERGHLMEERGEFQAAIDAYGKALKARPDRAEIYFDRGVAYGQMGKWKEAIDDYTQAVEHDPTLARAYNNRAAAYAHRRQFQEAVADFSKAISLDPASALAYRNRGLAYHDLGQFQQSIEDETVAIRLDPKAFEGYFERGNAYLDLKENEKAIADFDRALAINANNAKAWLNRGTAYRRLGNAAQAQSDFAHARQLDPDLAKNQPDTSAVEAAPTEKRAERSTSPKQARERALRAATEFLKSKGYQVGIAAPVPWDLVAEKSGRRSDVKVAVIEHGQPGLRFTREEIDAANRKGARGALIVIGEEGTSPTERGQVVRFEESWKPDATRLVPVVYEYRLP